MRLVPEKEKLQIELRGDLGAILSFAQKKGHPGARASVAAAKLQGAPSSVGRAAKTALMRRHRSAMMHPKRKP